MKKLTDFLKWLFMTIILSPFILGIWLTSFFVFWVFIVGYVTDDDYADRVKVKFNKLKG